jgi:hypothetical protein
MKNQPERDGKERDASPARSVLGFAVVYRFLRRSETLFIATGKSQ